MHRQNAKYASSSLKDMLSWKNGFLSSCRDVCLTQQVGQVRMRNLIAACLSSLLIKEENLNKIEIIHIARPCELSCGVQETQDKFKKRLI